VTGPRWAPLPASADAADAAAAQHRTAFAEEPDGVWAAPGRVTLIGEHVDYNDGRTLLLALPYRTVVAARRRDDDQVRLISAQADDGWSGSLDELEPGRIEGWMAYALGAVWAVRAGGSDVPGMDLAVDSAVPVGAGLSSSAALVCSVAAATCALAGAEDLLADEAGRARLAAIGVEAETIFVGAPTGGMDQAASVRARAGQALLLDCRDSSVAHLPLDLRGQGLALLVIDTEAPHRNADNAYAARRRTCEAAARQLGIASLRDVVDLDDALERLDDSESQRRVRHVVTEIDRVAEAATLLAAGQVEAIGPLLEASHRSLRDDYEVSCDELDLAVDIATEAGALGARMTGGGFGGSAIALIRREHTEAITVAVDQAFVAAGLRRPTFLDGTPSAPAERVR
jgi:galactokinase